MVQVSEYIDDQGRSRFKRWFNRLDVQAAIKATAALDRMGHGNISNTKSVGAGVMEYRIDYGSGYRIYFGWDSETLVVLLGGGTKKNQQADIETAMQLWQDYRHRKQEE